MKLNDLCQKLPGDVLSRRVAREEISTPKYIKFLTAPSVLEGDILYLTEAATAENCLPLCTTPGGATVLCAGDVPRSLCFQVNINFISLGCGLLDMHNAAADYLSEQRRNADIEEESLRRKFSDIMEMNYPSNYHVESICATFPKPLKSSYCVICVESHDSPGRTARDHAMRKELKDLFPQDNLTLYDNHTVIIHSYDGFTHPPKLPLDELSALLGKYSACAGVSNGMRKIHELRLMYILARKAIESGKTLSGGEKNVFFYDDTMLFSLISFMATSFLEQHNSDDIILLGNPILANIIKHDPNGKRGLVETLFQYIINGQSVSKTAEAMHMHRNTVKNRIVLIEQIAGEQFSTDGLLQAKLLITYYIIQYYNKVWHKNLVLSPLCEEHDKVISMVKP